MGTAGPCVPGEAAPVANVCDAGGSGRRTDIVKRQLVHLQQAAAQGFKVTRIEQLFLRFKSPGDNEQVMIHVVVFVEQPHVSRRHVGDEQRVVVGQKRVGTSCGDVTLPPLGLARSGFAGQVCPPPERRTECRYLR